MIETEPEPEPVAATVGPEIVIVAEGTVVVPSLLIVTSVVLCSVTVLERFISIVHENSCKAMKTNVREVGKTIVCVISSTPSSSLQNGPASTGYSLRASKRSSSTHSSGVK